MEGELSKACRFDGFFKLKQICTEQPMGSQWRFRDFALPTPCQFQSSAVSSPTSWLVFMEMTMIPKQGISMFIWQVIHNKAEWTKWEDILNTNASLPRDVYAGNMIIPTLDTVR